MAFCAACTVITGDSGRTVAIEIDGEAKRNVEEEDSITLSGRAIDASGDTVVDATIEWEILDPDHGFTIEGTTGVVQALSPDSGRVRARVDNLRSDAIWIVVNPAPDSIAVSGDTRIVFTAGSEASPDLIATVIDLTTDPQSPQPLANKLVTFSVTAPTPGSADAQGFFLMLGNDVVGADPHAISASTDNSGLASIKVGRVTGAALPDSATVEAAATTATGATVKGSPVTYTVIFEQTP